MTSSAPATPDDHSSLPWRGTLLLILCVALVRVIYLAFLCPYALIEDEAHYWEWSRRLDLSYATKGPGLAWACALSTKLFGHTEFAVRLPSVLFVSLATLGVAGLARDISRSARAGFLAAVAFILTPFALGAGTLLSVDMAYTACWALGAWAAWRAITTGSMTAAIALGLALGLGFLFKYTALLLLPGLLWFAWSRRARPGPLLGAIAIALLCTTPVIYWNSQHDWITFRHLLGHLGLPGGDLDGTSAERQGWTYEPKWTVEFIAIQFALIGPALLLGFHTLTRRARASLVSGGAAFALACALPTLVIYILVTFITEPEGNWAVGAYTTILSLAGVGAMHSSAGAPKHLWRATRILGTVLIVAVARLDLVAAIPRVGNLVPLGRLTSARFIAADAAVHADILHRETGMTPFIAAQHYGRASLLAFYMPGNPTVYCTNSVTGGRRTQYDFWPDTDLSDIETLGGRPALLMGRPEELWSVAFEDVSEPILLEGEHKRNRFAFLARGYRGFPKEQP